MTAARIKQWTQFIVALASLAGLIVTRIESQQKQANDFEVVRILSEQLAKAGRCE